MMNEYIEKGKEDEGKHLMRINVNVCGEKKKPVKSRKPNWIGIRQSQI